MATVTDALVTDFLVGKDQVTQKFNEINVKAFTTAENMGKFSGRMHALGINVEKMQMPTENLQKTFDSGFQRATKSASIFDMRLLSIMFMGMQLQRTFGGVLRSITNTFMNVEGNQSMLAKGVTGLRASWEFLKFSIFNALDQPVIHQFIESVIDAVNWVSKLINKHPALGTAIIAAFGVLAIGGAALMTIGQFALFYNAVFGVGGVLAVKTAAGMGTSAAAGSGTVVGAVGKGMILARTLVGAGLVIYATYSLVDDFTSKKKLTAWEALKTALTAGIGVGILTVNPVAGIIAFVTVLLAYKTVHDLKDKKFSEKFATLKEIIEYQQRPGYSSSMFTSVPEEAKLTAEDMFGPEEMENINKMYEEYRSFSVNQFINPTKKEWKMWSIDIADSISTVTESIGNENVGLINATSNMGETMNNTIPPLDDNTAAIDRNNGALQENIRLKKELSEIGGGIYGVTSSEFESSVLS